MTIDTLIKNRLREIEAEHKVEILLAVESGSRAWGFESTDSDYDVRFIYKHTLDWYLTVIPGRDVIEYPIIDLLDYSGWDIKKALFLLNKSNPVLLEWMHSPIVYYRNNEICDKLIAKASAFFSPLSSMYHYLHMAQGNYRDYLKRDTVKIKKYFYVLRPVFACMWIEKYNETPPMEFEKLLELLDPNTQLYDAICSLLEKKRSGIELGEEPRIEVINFFLDERMHYFEEAVSKLGTERNTDITVLDDLFREIVNPEDV